MGLFTRLFGYGNLPDSPELPKKRGIIEVFISSSGDEYRADFILGHGEYIVTGDTIDNAKKAVYEELMKIKEESSSKAIDEMYDIWWKI